MIPELSPLKQPIAIRPEFVAREDTSFRVQQEGKGAASTKFTIFSPENDVPKDEKGAIPETKKSPATLISVDGKYSSADERRSFLDASGLPLFDLYHTPRGTTWHIEVPGGNSPSLAFIEPQDSRMKDDYKVQFRNAAAEGGQDVLLRVQGQDIWKLRTNVLLGDKVVMTTKRLDKLSVYLPGSKVAWQVDVAEGMDMALAAAIVVVMGANMYTNGRSRGRIYIGKE
ncbi:hypothetical protein LMH87_011903 [Akanthomyces muscarius]|uniref:Tubby n=2 Tax=Akanthomyces TaxID=150366 RepID=A0A162K9X0_CORDF|nr:hypothetical protein LMH87_011903 [Akanthomyces muscarius]KAJ4151188.1 hypothetical protein LMH87_011903 [Akanthomyces muscarius]OAA79822.1 Tubby [Akanthomyces lecanii RCEF 1005]